MIAKYKGVITDIDGHLFSIETLEPQRKVTATVDRVMKGVDLKVGDTVTVKFRRSDLVRGRIVKKHETV